MDAGDGLRISDQQRERAVQEIREHDAAGRLTDEEMSDRVQVAYEAKTEADLRTTRADLPVLPPTAAEQRQELEERRGQLQRRVLQQSGGALVPFVICCVVWVASGAHGAFWPIWVALVTVVALLRNGWRLYGPAPELDRVEHELTRREHREERRSHGRRLGP